MPATDNYPTMLTVADEIRSILADERVSGGQLYSTEVLTKHIQAATREAFKLLRSVGNVHISRTKYVKLPANQMVLIPRAVGIDDMVAPIAVAWRSPVTYLTVSNAVRSGRNLIVTTSAAHGQTGNQVFCTLNDISGFPLASGLFTASVVDSDELTILGCAVDGEWSVDSSKANELCVSTASFNDTELVVDIGQTTYRSSVDDVTNLAGRWSNESGRINLPPDTVERQVRVVYYSSRETPALVSDRIEIPDCLDFIARLAASHATLVRMPTISERLRSEVWGRGREHSSEDGLARTMVLSAMRAESVRRHSDSTRPGYGAYAYPNY